MIKKDIHVVLCGGGTLGSVTPLLAVARAIRSHASGATFTWIGTEDGPEARLVKEAGIPFHAISAGKLRRYASWRNLIDPLRVMKGFFQAKRLLRELKADAVVTAGGYSAVPVVWAAGLAHIFVHVHQQDIRPGLANRLSLPYASSLSVALEASLDAFPGTHPEWTGNPVRSELLSGSRQEAERLFSLEHGVPTVLVLGGGTGAMGINNLVREALPQLTREAQVLHVTGKGKMIGGDAVRYRQFEFLTVEMPHAFAAADLVVTRAGMGTLTELAALGLPAIIVPMPNSHQEENAQLFAAKGAGVLLEEPSLSSKIFADIVQSLLRDSAKLDALGSAMRSMNRMDADMRIAEMVLRAMSS